MAKELMPTGADCRALLTASVSNVQFVSTAYRLCLLREPDDGGLANYAAALAEGTPRAQVIADLLTSSEGVAKRLLNAKVERGLLVALRAGGFWSAFTYWVRATKRGRAPLFFPIVPDRGVSAPVALFEASAIPRPVEIAQPNGARFSDGQIRIRVEPRQRSTTCMILVDGRFAAYADALADHESSFVRVPRSVIWNDSCPHVLQLVYADSGTFGPTHVIERDVRLAVDIIDSGRLEGWAADLSGACSLTVVLRGRSQVIRARANLPRPDVAKAIEGCSSCVGFALKFGPGMFEEVGDMELTIEERPGKKWLVSRRLPYVAIRDAVHSLRAAGFGPAFVANEFGALIRGAAPFRKPSVRMAYCGPDIVPEGEGVSVIIPVYRGEVATRECLESVMSSLNETSYEIILVDDASPDAGVVRLVEELAARGISNVVVIRRPLNGGFAEAVNVGLVAARRRDVVLLNSDTIVFDGWIDKLVAHSKRGVRVGTITPLSNNAEICSVPSICFDSPIEDLKIARRTDRVLTELWRGESVEVPVAIGFCMFISRHCLDEVGLLDSELWGRGYGEEVDFCLRASALGWSHVAAVDMFVVHRGAVSFGEDKSALVLKNSAKVSELYPFYDALIQDFIREDPIAHVRMGVALSLIVDGYLAEHGERYRGASVHVCHGLGGGTRRYVDALCRLERAAELLPVLVESLASGEVRVSFEATSGRGASEVTRHFEYKFLRGAIGHALLAIERIGIARVRLHSLLDAPSELSEWLKTRADLDIALHDYSWVCPRVALANGASQYCGLPAVGDCASCCSSNGIHPSARERFDAHSGDVGMYRQEGIAWLNRARRVYAGGYDVVARLRSVGFEREAFVRDHPDVQRVLPGRPMIRASGAVRVLVVGAIGDIKGAPLLLACAQVANQAGIDVEFVVVGYTSVDESLSKLTNVRVTGAFAGFDQLTDLVKQSATEIAFLPSLIPETFSYVLSDLFRLGMWPVVADIGVQAERVRKTGFGSLFSPQDDPLAVVNAIVEAARELRARSPVRVAVTYFEALEDYEASSDDV